MRAYGKKMAALVESRKEMEKLLRERYPNVKASDIRFTAEYYVTKAFNEISKQGTDGVLPAETGEASPPLTPCDHLGRKRVLKGKEWRCECGAKL